MSQHAVIAGGGRVGARTASVIEDYGHDLYVIERDADRCTELAERCRGVIVTGDATRTATVERAALDAVSLPPGSGIVADVETMTVAGSGTERRAGGRYPAAVEPNAAADRTALLRG